MGDFRVILLSGTSHPQLVANVGRAINATPTKCDIVRFADGEISIHVKEHIRGADVFLFQSCSYPDVNGFLVELLLLVHCLKLSSAGRIVAVFPYLPYARQDTKARPRVPLAASCVAEMIESMGADCVLTVDLHSEQIQGFFPTLPVDNLFSERELAAFVTQTYAPPLARTVIVSPDASGVPRARRFADVLGAASVATVLRRGGPNEASDLVGNVRGAVCVLVDDMIDTGSRVTASARLLRQNGADRVLACITHGLFSEGAIERINACPELSDIVVTDTVPQDTHANRCSKLRVCSIAHLLAEAVRRIHLAESISQLFEERVAPESSRAETM